MTKFLACLADCRRIDERHVGCRVRHQDSIKERLIAGLQIGQHEILLQIVVETGDFVVPTRDLEIDGRHGRRQQTFETPGAAFGLGERSAFVESRIMQ